MKSKTLFFLLLVAISVFNCSKNIEYSEEFKKETSGKYLYNYDDVMEVYYVDDELRLNWREGTFTPVVLSQNEFFVADMYKKLRFVKHPETEKRYLSIIPEDDDGTITYDYVKVVDTFKTPSTHLKEGNYQMALNGFMKIKKQDSTSEFINEHDFNSIGYRHLRDENYDDAIEVFKLNVALHPTSSNVYDSLADGYRVSGDSLQAYTYYKKALELDPTNPRAIRFIRNYESDGK